MIKAKQPRRPLRYLMVLFVALQIFLPVAGLRMASEEHRTFPFSWAMFSRIPEDNGGK